MQKKIDWYPIVFIAIIFCCVNNGWCLDVIAFGDSITAGSIDPDGTDRGGYPLVLQHIYDSQGANVTVYNRGLRGERTVDGVNRIRRYIGGSGYILIQEGNNDVIFGISPQTIVNNLSIMLDKCQATPTVPILGLLTPDSRHHNTEHIANSVNPLIRTLAQNRQVSLVNTFDAVAESWDVWSFDGLHPNYDGMLALARAWHRAIPSSAVNSGVPVSGASSAASSAKSEGGGGGGGCFIATAAFGSLFEPQVVVLRHFRDNWLLVTDVGKKIVNLYYKLSPPFAHKIAKSPEIRSVVRLGLYPLVGFAFLLDHGNISLLLLAGLLSFFIFLSAPSLQRKGD